MFMDVVANILAVLWYCPIVYFLSLSASFDNPFKIMVPLKFDLSDEIILINHLF